MASVCEEWNHYQIQTENATKRNEIFCSDGMISRNFQTYHLRPLTIGAEPAQTSPARSPKTTCGSDDMLEKLREVTPKYYFSKKRDCIILAIGKQLRYAGCRNTGSGSMFLRLAGCVRGARLGGLYLK
jgi:hypothetical protein